MKKPPIKGSFDPSQKLPDDIQTCHDLIRELFTRVAELEKQISRKNRALLGKKSAKVDAALLTGTGKVIHQQTTSELNDEKQRLQIVPEQKHGGGRAAPSPALPTRAVEHFVDESQLPCPDCGTRRTIIGFESAGQIEFVKSVFEYIQHRMFKYACQKCDQHIVINQKPYQPIDKGSAGPGLLAKIATDKFWLHLPLYRQEQIFKSLNIPINRASMSRWLAEIADLLAPIVNRMLELIRHSDVVQSDATTLPVIKKNLGKTHRGFAWVYRGDSQHPYVFYDYSDTEHSKYPERILDGYTGILQTDGTNKFNEIIRRGATSANCWAHVHCYFEDAWTIDPVGAEFPMGVIKSLFDIERTAKTLSFEARKGIRQRLAKPKIESLKIWLDERKYVEPPKTKLADAISYTLNRWQALLVYLEHGNVEISNNGSERSIKPLVLSRRNWLFAGSENGAKTAATLMSLIESCKRLDINPFEYLKDVLTRFPSSTLSQLDDFLPDRWLALTKAN
jgi:transposase